jgi:hypothetical protein
LDRTGRDKPLQIKEKEEKKQKWEHYPNNGLRMLVRVSGVRIITWRFHN